MFYIFVLEVVCFPKKDDAIAMFNLLKIAILLGSCHIPFTLKGKTLNCMRELIEVVI